MKVKENNFSYITGYFFKDFPLVGQTAKRAPNFYGQLLQFTYRDSEVQMLIYNLSSSRSMKLRNESSQNNLQTARFIPKIFSNKFTFFVELFADSVLRLFFFVMKANTAGLGSYRAVPLPFHDMCIIVLMVDSFNLDLCDVLILL